MATRTSLMEFQIPKIVHEEIDENRGVFQIEPLDRGFGYTFGNSLRRVLLSSLEGAAVTSVKIEGVAHEFTTLPGVREDVMDIILNLKNLICRLEGDSPEIEVRLSKRGAGAVTAPGPRFATWTSTSGDSPWRRQIRFLRLRMMSVTSSRTPGRVVNSCATPSILTAVTAAPSSDESSTRRSELPNV